ncbi:ABC transporter permease [Solimicrobium silvestre]|uniref:ABC-2 family transporter protein n=1 Tax=Solimicrobium silvestre TaxID=2099400 RepID=A0A2S9GSL3_9BURK|nr:ABC transporter permease [Solimicrobium silvestre]PRC90701.1 ABC-2 family transporter protein [Solimicrobium silvestre]
MSTISRRRLIALCRKESYQIVRDPSSILIAFVLPVILLFIFGYGINLDTNRVRIGLVVEDSGVEAQRFADVLTGSPYLEVHTGHSRSAMQDQLQNGSVRGMVVLGSDFSAKVQQAQTHQTQDQAQIQLLTDGAEPNTANFLSSYLQGSLQIWLTQRASDRGLPDLAITSLEPRYWFNPTTVSRNYLVPGSISVIMTVIGALLTSLVVAREWERGTMEALLSTSVTRSELLLSKIIPYYMLGMIAMSLCVLVATVLMGVPLRGSYWMLFIVSSLFLGSSLGLGLLLSTVTRNQFVAAQGALVAAFLPATMLSGFVFEIASMPLPVRAISYLIPARYFVSALQTIFQAGDIWPVLLLNTGFLLLSALFWLGLTALKTARRLDGN